MGIRDNVEQLRARLHDRAQYPGQGAVLFVDLEHQATSRAYLPAEVLRNFLGGRGANMALLYNLLDEAHDALDPEVPLIFGAGTLTGEMPSATRGNFTSRSPESRAILDASAGDYFPAFVKRHGYDHIVLYGRARQWTLLKICHDEVEFVDATMLEDPLQAEALYEKVAARGGTNQAEALQRDRPWLTDEEAREQVVKNYEEQAALNRILVTHNAPAPGEPPMREGDVRVEPGRGLQTAEQVTGRDGGIESGAAGRGAREDEPERGREPAPSPSPRIRVRHLPRVEPAAASVNARGRAHGVRWARRGDPRRERAGDR